MPEYFIEPYLSALIIIKRIFTRISMKSLAKVQLVHPRRLGEDIKFHNVIVPQLSNPGQRCFYHHHIFFIYPSRVSKVLLQSDSELLDHRDD